MQAVRRSIGAVVVLVSVLAVPGSALAEAVAVKHWEGLAHGFISLRTLEGKHLAEGDLVETTTPTPAGNRVTTRLTLRFEDGSLHEESTVYQQRKTFRFVSNHVVQRGPAFKRQLESTISASGKVSVRSSGEDGKEERLEEQVELPQDVSNGMILALLKNLSPRTPKTTVSMLAITPKPRLVKLEISPDGEDPFSTGGTRRKATRYRVKVHVPGVTGAVASLLGKVPPDSLVWVFTGEAPTFVKAELALALDGPTWRLEMSPPVWPASSAPAKEEKKEEKAENSTPPADAPRAASKSDR